MSGIIFLILAAIQGVTGLLPISGFGHIVLLCAVLGISGSLNMTAVLLLHLGTAAAVIYQFRRDIFKTLLSVVDLVMDIVHNFTQWVIHRADPENAEYNKLLRDNYSRLFVLITVYCAVSGVLSLLIAKIFGDFISNLIVTAVGFLVTALVLYVSSYTIPSKRGPKDTGIVDGVITGLFGAFGVLPGFSNLGLTQSGTFFCGFSDKFTRRSVYILSLPLVFGELIFLGAKGMLAGFGVPVPFVILGMAISAFVGIVTLKVGFREAGRENNRRFAVYAVGAAVVALVVYFIRG